MRTLACAALVALAWLAPRVSSAQAAFTVEAGLVTDPDATLLPQLGVRATAAKARRVGVDFAVATLPAVLVQGVVLFTPDLDVTLPLPVGAGGSWLMPRIGASALLGVGGGFDGAAEGYNIGIGWLGETSPRKAIRLDLTYRRYMIDELDGHLLVTVGIGWSK